MTLSHAEATVTLAAERYLLDMLSAGEREAFEEHFFDCPWCADAVRLGAIFTANLKAALRAGRGTVKPPQFLDLQPFEAIVDGQACGYFTNAPCAAQTARYCAERARLESKRHRKAEGQFCAGAAEEVRWCVFDHRAGKMLTAEELCAAALARLEQAENLKRKIDELLG